jgi:hypothetical protein
MVTRTELTDLDGNTRCYLSPGMTDEVILRMFAAGDGHDVTLVAAIELEELKSAIRLLEEEE